MSEYSTRPRPRRTTPATEKRFTEITWPGIGNQYGRDIRSGTGLLGWEVQHDLAIDLWKTLPHVDYETAASAVEAAASGLPVHIVWENPFSGMTEVHSGFGIIEEVVFSADPSLTRLRLRYLGFAHYVYATQVRSIEQVGVTASYEEAK